MSSNSRSQQNTPPPIGGTRTKHPTKWQTPLSRIHPKAGATNNIIPVDFLLHESFLITSGLDEISIQQALP